MKTFVIQFARRCFVVLPLLCGSLVFGASEQPVFTYNWGQPGPIYTLPTHTDNQFGYSLASFGTTQFLVGIPLRPLGAVMPYIDDAGSVGIFGTNGFFLDSISHPFPVAGDRFGYAVASVGTTRIIVSAPYTKVGRAPNESLLAGTVYIFDQNGNYLDLITNPEAEDYDFFGITLAGLGTSRILIGNEYDLAISGSVYIYNTSGTLLTTVRNPTPANSDHFGSGLAAVGTDRFVVGAYGDDTTAANAGQAYLYNQSGVALRTNAPGGLQAGDQFGYAAAGVATNWYVVSAPSAEVQNGR